MLKKLSLFILFAAALFTACKKDQSAEADTSVQITGKWTYVKDSINYYRFGQFSNMQVFKYSNEYMQFNNDGTGRNAETTFTYNVNGSTLTLNFAAYTAGGVDYPEDQSVANILTLTDHKLYLFYDYIATGNNSVYATLSK